MTEWILHTVLHTETMTLKLIPGLLADSEKTYYLCSVQVEAKPATINQNNCF